MNHFRHLYIAIALAAVFTLGGCGDSSEQGDGTTAATPRQSAQSSKKLLAGYPALERSWFEKINQKREEFERSKPDREKMAALSEEYVQLQKGWAPAIQEYTAAQQLVGKAVPFEPLPVERPFSIIDASITQALQGSLIIYANMELNEELPEPREVESEWLDVRRTMRAGDETDFKIWVKLVDSKGQEIPGTKKAMRTVSRFKKDQLKPGLTFRMSLQYNTGEIIQMDDFAKVVEITREEYEAK